MDENTSGFYTSQISTANSPGCVLLFKKWQRKYYNQLERDSGYLISQPCYIMTMEENLKISKWEHFVSHTTQILFMVHHEHRKPRVWWRNNRTVKENLSSIIQEKEADKTKWCSYLLFQWQRKAKERKKFVSRGWATIKNKERGGVGQWISPSTMMQTS